MGMIDRLMTRRRGVPSFAALAQRKRRRLASVCRELNDAEQEVADYLGLARPPRLLLVDEEDAVILTPDQRAETG